MSRARDLADRVLHNRTHEDTEGGRESIVTFKGEQSGGEISTLAQIQASHDGTADDEKADLIFKTNDGSDGASPTERMRISSDSTFTFASDDAGAGIGPNLVYYRNSSSPADNDLLAEIDHRGRNDNSQDVDYATVNIFAEDVSDGTEDGKYLLQTIKAGATVSRMDVNSTETVFNDDSKDIDFRIESDNDANAFFVQGSDGKIGIGTSTVSNTFKTELNHSGQTFGLKLTDGSHSIKFGAGGPEISSTGARFDIRTTDNNEMRFYTNNTERMRVDGSGNLFFGKTVTAATTTGVTLSQAARFNIATSSGEPFYFYYSPTGAGVGSITHGGSSTSFNTSSDYRLKENVTDVTDGITRVKQLAPKRFNFIVDADTTVDGFLAHEAQTVVPEAVVGTKDAVDEDGNIKPQGIDQSKLVPLLTAALQEAIGKIETLETENTAIKARLDALEAE